MREEMLVDVEVADIILRHLDKDGNEVIDKEEFESGIKKLLISRNLHKQSLAHTGVRIMIKRYFDLFIIHLNSRVTKL